MCLGVGSWKFWNSAEKSIFLILPRALIGAEPARRQNQSSEQNLLDQSGDRFPLLSGGAFWSLAPSSQMHITISTKFRNIPRRKRVIFKSQSERFSGSLGPANTICMTQRGRVDFVTFIRFKCISFFAIKILNQINWSSSSALNLL